MGSGAGVIWNRREAVYFDQFKLHPSSTIDRKSELYNLSADPLRAAFRGQRQRQSVKQAQS